MPCVIGVFFEFDKHIIDINLHGFTHQWSEYLSHHPLISCPYVFPAKWHYVIAVQSVWCNEVCFLHVRWMHRNLMVSKVSINDRIPCPNVVSTI